MAAKTAASKKKAAPVKSPKMSKVKTTKTAAVPTKMTNKYQKDRLHTGFDPALVEKAAEALLKYHEKQSGDKMALLGTDQSVQVQFTLLRTPGQGNPKPVRLLIPHPLYQLADHKASGKKNIHDNLEEAEICLIVKEESKAWCQEMIDRFPEHMGCVKKVLGLQSLRNKHARYEQRRELLNKYNFFMADDRILPMLSKALGKDFFQAKKLPIPINLTRKEALPFVIQKALSATYMTISTGTCINIRAGTTSMSAQQLTENICEIAATAVPKMPHKWANVQNVAIKTPDSVALPIYSKTPQVLRELAKLAGLVEDVDVPETDEDSTPKKATNKAEADDKDAGSAKKREMKSPLLRALKKQKADETKKAEQAKVAKNAESKKETKKAEKTKVTKNAESKKETPRQKKRRTASEGSKDEEVVKSSPAKKSKADKKGKETPKSGKKAQEAADSETKGKAMEESGEKKVFIAEKKFKGSKKGYVFKMGKQGVGYYVDIKPKVNLLAMEALTRMAKNKSRRSGQQNNKSKGKRQF